MAGNFTPKFPAVIDSSILSDWKRCKQYAFNSHFRGMGSLYRNEHLHFGGCFAHGLEIARRAHYSEGHSTDDAEAMGYVAMTEMWGDYEPWEGSVKNKRNLDLIYANYFQEYPMDTCRYKPWRATPDSEPAIEFSFVAPIGNLIHPDTDEPLLYAGRLDMLAYDSYLFGDEPWNATEVYALDEKTTKQMGASWGNDFQMRGQFVGYTWGICDAGIPCKGAIVRGVCVYKRNPPKYQELPVFIDATKVDRWHTGMLGTVEDMIYRWDLYNRMKEPKTDVFSYDFNDGCTAFGGCHLREYCELQDQETYIQSMFKERRWNPLTREEENYDGQVLVDTESGEEEVEGGIPWASR